MILNMNRGTVIVEFTSRSGETHDVEMDFGEAMTHQHIQNVVDRMTFGDGIEAGYVAGERRWMVSVKALNGDSAANIVGFVKWPGEDTPVTDLNIAKAIRDTILDGFKHEVDETTMLDGKRLRNPHPGDVEYDENTWEEAA